MTEKTVRGFSTLTYNLTPNDQFRLVVSARRDDYQIPNTPGQLAGDVQREADSYALLSWVRSLSSSVTLTSSLFYHYNRADYDGAAWDEPISTTAQRSSSYFGGQESLHASAGRNTLDAGLYALVRKITSSSTSCSTMAAIRPSSSH